MKTRRWLSCASSLNSSQPDHRMEAAVAGKRRQCYWWQPRVCTGESCRGGNRRRSGTTHGAPSRRPRWTVRRATYRTTRQQNARSDFLSRSTVARCSTAHVRHVRHEKNGVESKKAHKDQHALVSVSAMHRLRHRGGPDRKPSMTAFGRVPILAPENSAANS